MLQGGEGSNEIYRKLNKIFRETIVLNIQKVNSLQLQVKEIFCFSKLILKQIESKLIEKIFVHSMFMNFKLQRFSLKWISKQISKKYNFIEK